MRKKSVLALLLALMIILSGCTLVTKDEEKDNARVIIDVNGETVTKHVVTAAVQNQISQNEYYNQMFAAYGYSGVYSTDEATVTAQVIDSFVENLVLKQKAYAMGMNELTDEERPRPRNTPRNTTSPSSPPLSALTCPTAAWKAMSSTPPPKNMWLKTISRPRTAAPPMKISFSPRSMSRRLKS